MSDDNNRPILEAIAGLRTIIEGMAGVLEQTSTEVIVLKAAHLRTRVELMERMDPIQDTMTQLRDEVMVSFGAAEQVSRTIRNVQDDVRGLNEQINTVFRMARRLDERVRHLEEKNGGGQAASSDPAA